MLEGIILADAAPRNGATAVHHSTDFGGESMLARPTA